MENAAVSKAISDTALVFLFPFLMMVGHLGDGWNKEKIKKDNKIILEYQVFVPSKKSDASKNSVPVVIVIKDRGGKLTAGEVKLVEARSQETGQAIVIPKSPGSEWVAEDSVLINKLLADLTVKRILDLNKTELVALNSGNPVAAKLLCSTQIKFQKVYLLGKQEEIKECEGGITQNAVYLNNGVNKSLWQQKSQALHETPAKSLSEFLKN